MARAKRFSSLKRGFRRFATYASEKVRHARSSYKGWRSRSHDDDQDAYPRHVVITGIGAITVLGLDAPTTWRGLVAGKSGIGPITQFDPGTLPVRIAGEVKGFDPLNYLEPKEARRMARCSQFAVAAAKEAAADARLVIGESVKPERTGVVVGTALGGFEMID